MFRNAILSIQNNLRDSVHFAIIGIAKQRNKPPLKGGFLFLSERVNMQETPNYYAILTADVRYNKKLSPMAKLLYAEITALAQKEGYAWASNGYFAKLYDVHTVTVSKWVSELVKEKLITIKVDVKAGNLRKITISQNAKGLSEKTKTYKRKDLDPLSKKANIILQENNKRNNRNGYFCFKHQDNFVPGGKVCGYC